MSDSYITVFPEKVDKEDAKELADKFVNYLILKKIIKNELTDCTLGDNGYPPGDNYKTAIDNDYGHIEELITNGLEVITEKKVFHNGGGGIDSINCPNCNYNMIDSDWGDLLDEWYNDSGNGNLKCSGCKHEFPIINYNFNPFWGFGYLGFNFWNWGDLNDKFIKEIESLLNVKMKLIYGRL